MLVIDHDHETDRVRGMLCRRCNAALGMLRDDPAIMDAAADYVRRSLNRREDSA